MRVSRPCRISKGPQYQCPGSQASSALSCRYTVWLLVERLSVRYGRLQCTPL